MSRIFTPVSKAPLWSRFLRAASAQSALSPRCPAPVVAAPAPMSPSLRLELAPASECPPMPGSVPTTGSSRLGQSKFKKTKENISS